MTAPAATTTTSAATLAEARRHGRRTVVVGLAIVALTIGSVAVAAAMDAKSTMVSGTAFILGWIITGFGLGESMLGNRLGLVRMLLALLVGIAGVIFNFWAIHAMGFDLRR